MSPEGTRHDGAHGGAHDGVGRASITDLAGLIRAGADGELTAEEHRLLEDHLRREPDGASRLEFERRLKGAVGRSMEGAYPAPAGLRERVQSAIRADEGDPEPYVEEIAPRTRNRSFWRGGGGRLVGVAAILLLAFGLSYFAGPDDPILRDQQGKIRLAGFLTSEHRHCGDDPDHAESKFDCRDPNAISESSEAWLGTPVALAHIFDGGARLVGMGLCRVPGPGRSVHLQMTLVTGIDPSGPLVSVFIQEAPAGEGITPGVAYDLEEAERDGAVINVWRDEDTGLVYYLVCDDPEAAEAARQLLEIPPPTRRL